MDDNSEHFDRDHSPECSDDAIRQVLLGRMESATQTLFEERLFLDDEFEARVRLLEIELTDDYVFERLGRADRERFQRNFLVSTDRKRALEVSKALHDRFSSTSLFGSKSAIARRLRSLFDINLRWISTSRESIEQIS